MNLETFSRLVPDSLRDCSGEVFYSGRAAFSGSRDVYLLGYNPGSDPSVERQAGDELNTVRSSIEKACRWSSERFSLYYQEWEKGLRQTMQMGIRRFFAESRLDPCLTPSSNCIFVRRRTYGPCRAETPWPMKDQKLTPRITETAKALWYIYLGLTILCALSYRLAGMDWFDAVAHSFSSVAIGGFSTHDARLGHFQSPAVEGVAMVFMALAGINFALHFVA